MMISVVRVTELLNVVASMRKGGPGNRIHCLTLVIHRGQLKHLPQATGKDLSIMNISLPHKKTFEKDKSQYRRYLKIKQNS